MNFLDFSSTVPEMPFILEGLGVTLKVVAAAAVLGFLLGVLITLLKISSIKPLAWIADFYTSISQPEQEKPMPIYYLFLVK